MNGTKMRPPLFYRAVGQPKGPGAAERPNFPIAKFKLQFPTCRITTKI